MNNCVFCSGRIRTLDAMATYSSHRLVMGKKGICNFFCLIGDIWNLFLQKCLLSFPDRANIIDLTFHTQSLNLYRPRGYKTFFMLNSAEHEI